MIVVAIHKNSTLATLRVIRAGGMGHRKSRETPGLLEGKGRREKSSTGNEVVPY
jgi:hypothetical protein